jgi:hypothetical protein
MSQIKGSPARFLLRNSHGRQDFVMTMLVVAMLALVVSILFFVLINYPNLRGSTGPGNTESVGKFDNVRLIILGICSCVFSLAGAYYLRRKAYDEHYESYMPALVNLQQERQALATGAATDQEKLRSLERKIDAQLVAHRKLTAEIDAKEAELIADLESARTTEALPSVNEICSAGIVGKRPLTRPLVTDPNPVSADTTDRVIFDGFALKGDP